VNEFTIYVWITRSGITNRFLNNLGTLLSVKSITNNTPNTAVGIASINK